MAPVNKAPLEGVAARVEIRDGDAHKLYFPDDAVDVVSGLAPHNILSFAKIPVFNNYWTSISAPATVDAIIQVLLAFIPTIGSVFKLNN